MEISMQDVINKMAQRVSKDAQSLAILEASSDAYLARIKELEEELESYKSQQRP